MRRPAAAKHPPPRKSLGARVKSAGTWPQIGRGEQRGCGAAVAPRRASPRPAPWQASRSSSDWQRRRGSQDVRDHVPDDEQRSRDSEEPGNAVFHDVLLSLREVGVTSSTVCIATEQAMCRAGIYGCFADSRRRSSDSDARWRAPRSRFDDRRGPGVRRLATCCGETRPPRSPRGAGPAKGRK